MHETFSVVKNLELKSVRGNVICKKGKLQACMDKNKTQKKITILYKRIARVLDRSSMTDIYRHIEPYMPDQECFTYYYYYYFPF